MKKILLLLVIAGMMFPAFSQVEIWTGEEKQKDVFTVVEVEPEFPGGEEARLMFLAQNVKYPQKAREQGIQGRVFVSFIIEADGSVSNVRILRDVGGGLGEEAVRVVKLMPKWTPGYQRGEAVRVQYNMPINFILQDDHKKKKKKRKLGKDLFTN